MRKVLHIRASRQLLGAERVVLELANFLPHHGYEVSICVPIEPRIATPELVEQAQKEGYNVVTFPISGAFDLSIAKRIRRYVTENNIDIIHSHGYREDLYAILARSGAKLVATNHLWKKTTPRLKFYAALDAWLLKLFHTIIAVSSPVKQEMQEAGIKPENMHVISNGIDTAKFEHTEERSQLREAFGFTPEKIVIGSVSSLTVEKGINYLIEAFSELNLNHPNTFLYIVGDGPEEASLKALVEKHDLGNNVTFAGRRSDVNKILTAIDIFALPSLNEGMPMAMLEAMAAGRAIVASDVGDVSAALTNETGILVDPKKVGQLVAALTQLVIDPSALLEIGMKAKERVNTHFSGPSMAKQYADIYTQVMN